MSFTCIVRLTDGRDAIYTSDGPPGPGDDPILKVMQRVHRKIVSNEDPIPGDLQKVSDWWDEHEKDQPV